MIICNDKLSGILLDKGPILLNVIHFLSKLSSLSDVTETIRWLW